MEEERRGEKERGLGMTPGFGTSKSTPSGEFPQAKSHLLTFPKQDHQLGAKCSNTRAYRGCSHSNHRNVFADFGYSLVNLGSYHRCCFNPEYITNYFYDTSVETWIQ